MLRLPTRLRIHRMGVPAMLKDVRVPAAIAPAKTSISAARTKARKRQSEETASSLLSAPMVEKLSALVSIHRYARMGREFMGPGRRGEPMASLP